MRPLTLTQDARAARNAASIVRADDGAGNASIQLYDASGGTLLATRALAKPCASVRALDGRLVLAPSSANDLVQVTGAATWGEWRAADGTLLASGPVTDEAGRITDGTGLLDTGDIGPWVLSGTSGTQLYAGGIVLLTAGVIW